MTSESGAIKVRASQLDYFIAQTVAWANQFPYKKNVVVVRNKEEQRQIVDMILSRNNYVYPINLRILRSPNDRAT